jgi:hypothetical protein
MPGTGPPPAPTKRRRNVDPIPTTAVVDDGTYEVLAGPELPSNIEWHPMTVALWDALRRSPLLAEEPPLGWHFLMDTALMHSTMWEKGRWEFASEVRLRLAKFGVTPEDRARLRIKVVTPADKKRKEEPATPAASVARRRNMHIAG